jgi:hypothetical protein
MKIMETPMTSRNRRERRGAGQRIRWILLILATVMITYSLIRVKMARQYMETQIERLEREGKGSYVIQGSEFLAFSVYTGPAITIRAIAPESPRFPGGDKFHHIEIDYPWIPFLFRASHRI